MEEIIAIITTDEALGVYGAVDCGGYVSNFMLAAQALGLATVPQAALGGGAGIEAATFGLGGQQLLIDHLVHHPAKQFG